MVIVIEDLPKCFIMYFIFTLWKRQKPAKNYNTKQKQTMLLMSLMKFKRF